MNLILEQSNVVEAKLRLIVFIRQIAASKQAPLASPSKCTSS
jgi:hypothetical protein